MADSIISYRVKRFRPSRGEAGYLNPTTKDMEKTMKRICLFMMILVLLPALALAETMVPGPHLKPLPSSKGMRMPAQRDMPSYTFTKEPTAIITNYYDYMIGSYNGLPLRVIPDAAGGGYFMSYHGRRQANSTRRVFYAYINHDDQGVLSVINNNEITSVQNHEGYCTTAVDPVSGKPFYAWHCNKDTDAENEVEVASDAFMAGISGLFNIQVAIDNPITITSPSGVTTENNEFIWPTAQIGPSPVAGKRRVYLATRNYVTGTQGPSENLMIAYTDFDGIDIETNVPLTWNHVTIPEMNQWNVDAQWRRPFHSLTTDNAGNVYYAGYHFAVDSDGETNIREPDLDVFICPNYGQGEWTRISDYSWIPSCNPPLQQGSNEGLFVNEDSIPYPDSVLVWAIANSSHLNASLDKLGRIHVLGIWTQSTKDGIYWPRFQVIKEFVFDPATQEFTVKDVFPQKHPDDTFNPCFVPWDMEAPWGTPEYFQADDGNYYLTVAAAGGGHPGLKWPFPHWDQSAHGELMFFHYNNVKITNANDKGMMAAVWQDSQRARWFNADSDTDYAAFANTPEIFIAVSPDNGITWSEPIILNNVETPQFSGIKPMWVYPADQVIFTRMQDQHKVGKLGFMFYNDFTWGSNAITPAYHNTPDGGEVMFMELEIVFPVGSTDGENTAPAITRMLHQNYPNPFNPETTIGFDLPKSSHANLSVYNVKGQLVKTITDGNLEFGKHSFVWNGTDNDGRNVSSGIYFYRLTANGNVETKKMMLMK